jgi:hypothetical protein
MRFTTIISVCAITAGVLLVVPGLVFGVPGATPSDDATTAAPSVAIAAADTPGGQAVLGTDTEPDPSTDPTIDVHTVTVDGAQAATLAGPGSATRVFTVTNTDTGNQPAKLWINAASAKSGQLRIVDADTGASLTDPDEPAIIQAGETLAVEIDPAADTAATSNTAHTGEMDDGADASADYSVQVHTAASTSDSNERVTSANTEPVTTTDTGGETA